MANMLINEMQTGDRNAIYNGLFHSGAIYRMNAIAFATLHNIKDVDTISRIKELQNDDIMLDGFTVSDFANASLSLLKAEAYTGDKRAVKALIGSKFQFMKQ